MVHSEVYVNKCGQHSAVLYTCLSWLLSKYSENCSFLHVFAFQFFIHFSRRGQLTPFAPMCGRPWIRTLHTSRNWEDSKLKSFLQNKTAHTETISTTLFITRWQKKQTCNGTETNCVNDQTITSNVTNIHTRTYTHWVRLINELECSPNVSEHWNCIIFSSELHTKSLAWYTHSLQYRFWYLAGDMNLLQAKKSFTRTFYHASSRMKSLLSAHNFPRQK